MPNKARIGLVLSGGGAKGAYEVGVLNALVKCDITPEVIAGASIGAVNAAIIASNNNFKDAVNEIHNVWKSLTNEQVKLDIESLTNKRKKLLYLAMIFLRQKHGFKITYTLIAGLKKIFNYNDDDEDFINLMDHSPLEEVLEHYLDIDFLKSEQSIDLYISCFKGASVGKYLNELAWVIEYARYFFSDSKSTIFKIKDLRRDEIQKVIKASTAIPLAFKPVQVDGDWYYDGFLGGRKNVQGNTPVQPLIDAGCTHAVVVIIGDNVPWDRYSFPTLEIIEVRPTMMIDEGGVFETALNFSPERVKNLIEQGEADGLKSIIKVQKALGCVNQMSETRKQLDVAIKRLNDSETVLENIVNKL